MMKLHKSNIKIGIYQKVILNSIMKYIINIDTDNVYDII